MGGIWLLVMSIYPSLTCVYTLVLIWKESYSGGTTEMINYWSINIGRQNTSQKSFHMHSDDDHGASEKARAFIFIFVWMMTWIHPYL